MKINIIRKNTGLNGISIERQIEIPDYDMTLLKLSTMTPYLEGRRVHKTLDHNKKKDIPLNTIIYEASKKLIENPSKPYPQSGLDTAAFRDSSDQRLTMTSHTFENGTGTIEFDGDIASIGRWAFYQCTGLTSVTIPNSVTNIGESAFQGCSLTNIDIPNNVISIGINAFSNTKLLSIIIPNSITSIKGDAFSNCSNLSSIIVDSGNNVYNSKDNCNAIIETASNTLIKGCNNTSIPNSVISIGNYAFQGCSSLTSVTIPNSVTSIGNSAFQGCSKLTSIIIPSSVTSIGNTCFADCSILSSVVIPNSVTSIGTYAFSSCRVLKSVTIPNSVTSIDKGTFSNCTSLISIDIPNSIINIGENAFFNCYSLANVTIPNSVTSIGVDAFKSCSGLESVIIGNSVTSIDIRAFYGCRGLASITSFATTAPSIQSTTFQNVKSGGTLYVPGGSSGYNVWMGTGNYYLGKYSWTKVEQ